MSPAVEVIHIESVHPVEDIEESIESKCGDVMRSNVFDESDLVEHHDLRDESDSFKPQTVAPHELPRGPATVDDQSKHERCRK